MSKVVLPAGFTPGEGIMFGAEGSDAVGVSPANPLPVAGPRLDPTVWPDGTVAQDMHVYRDVELEIVGTPSVPIAVQRSIVANGSFPTAKGYGAQQAGMTSITAAGTYSFQGFGLFKFTGGTGATVYIRGSN